MIRDTVRFRSGTADIHAWHFRADRAPDEADAPCVVMAHGLAGTKDSGLAPFAEAFARAGIDTLAFDFRGFGDSGGAPRQKVSMRAQVDDYRAALSAARALPGVDPARLVAWGVSLSGGHVFELAAETPALAAAVALTPLVSGPAAAAHSVRERSPREFASGVLDGVRSAASRGTRRMPVVGPPGTHAALTSPGADESYRAIAGPSWRNEVDPGVLFELPSYRPARHARRINVPMLVQIADFDRSAPPDSAARAAFDARALVHRYPCDHFDVWPGTSHHTRAVEHQVRFVERVVRQPL
ncbi:alpha/beta hydrolase [Rhodococcus sp. HNM0569]|uniref:alpha/beta hydrolase n=1 Tax=Rhodococcus sp. HNM0569 TaxID=2716340 RepID=UPI00146D4D61|nr:alpha/beta hydrolase [Rhodococcus sp. HNM0569]NLU84746.1 alpha/beta fold hydrolase [Rhodococcus sp. HNM0569]